MRKQRLRRSHRCSNAILWNMEVSEGGNPFGYLYANASGVRIRFENVRESGKHNGYVICQTDRPYPYASRSFAYAYAIIF